VEITKPRWVICENPPGFLSIDGGLAFESVVAGLEGAGYWVENFIIPASAVGAWHRRDRLWIIAHDDRNGHDRQERHAPESGGNEPEDGLSFRTSSDPDNRSNQRRKSLPEWRAQGRIAAAGDNQGVDADFDLQGSQIREVQPGNFRQEFAATIGDPWNMHWLQAVGELCPVVHGIPFPDLTPDKAKWIAAMGDSVVPQVAAEIMKAIKEAMEDDNSRRKDHGKRNLGNDSYERNRN
jgi:DNA (cytosine-5)-methyltransferase 1